MLESYPPASPGRQVGLGLIVGLFLLDIALLVILFSQPISILTFLWSLTLVASIPSMLFIAYWTRCLSAARYYVDNNVLLIEWGRLRHAIPLEHIRGLTTGQHLKQISGFRGIRWPGHMVGKGAVTGEDQKTRITIFYATRPLTQQLLVETDSQSYALSPADPDDFKTCLEALQQTEFIARSSTVSIESGFPGWRILGDRPALISLAAALLLNGALFAYITAVFGSLPDQVPLHFDRLGNVDRVSSPASLFVLPVIGLVAILIAAVFGWFFYYVRDEKPVAYIIWGVTVVVQAATWIAILGLMG